jgi:hypothetical protein
MAQDPTTDDQPRQSSNAPQHAGTLVMTSVMSHARLLGMMKERNPIIANRDKRNPDTSPSLFTSQL